MIKRIGPCVVKNTILLTSTPYVAIYFFSNSPVKCLFTNVVFPTPPSPTMTNLNSPATYEAIIF